MTDENPSNLLIEIQNLAQKAGQEILRIYRSGNWTVSPKNDDSPLTQADIAANEIIVNGLRKLSSDPIVSEESDPQTVQVGNRFWLVDPLDGTREFVARNDTFVVSIGFVENGYPTLGVIYSPVLERMWWAVKGEGAFTDGEDGEARRLHNDSDRRSLIMAVSRSAPDERLAGIYDSFSIKEVQRYGSALKFCRLAEGVIDLYPRYGQINEWDTAAGQIIAEEAGCKIIDLVTRERLRYGKERFAHNGGFVALREDLELK